MNVVVIMAIIVIGVIAVIMKAYDDDNDNDFFT
jgi:hypothetical protein